MLLLCVDFKSNNHLHNYMYSCTKYLVKLYSCTAVLWIVQQCTQLYICSVYGRWPTHDATASNRNAAVQYWYVVLVAEISCGVHQKIYPYYLRK